MTVARARKAVAAVLGAVGVAVSLGLVPDTVGDWLAVAIAFAAALGVYAVPNDPEPLTMTVGAPLRIVCSECRQPVATILAVGGVSRNEPCGHTAAITTEPA